MQRTCVKCGYQNDHLPTAVVCPKCMSPYGRSSAAGAAVAAGPALQADATGGYRVMRIFGLALAGIMVVLAVTSWTDDMGEKQRARAAQAAAQADQQRGGLVQQAIGEGRVLVGMRAGEVRQAWGDPSAVNTTVRAAETDEQWVYRRGNGATQFVYLSNGVVRTVQTSGG